MAKRGRPKKITNISVDEMVRLYKEKGCNLEEIAKIAGVCFGTIANRLDEVSVDRRIGRMTKGSKHTDETRAKMRASHIGMGHTTETKAKISAANTGHKVSKETREKLRKANIGKKGSKEKSEKLKALWRNPKYVAKTHAAWKKTFAYNNRISAGQKRLYEILESLNISFFKDGDVFLKKRHGRHAWPDTYIPYLGLVIEYDGHSSHYTTEGRKYDEQRDKDLLSLHGITTVRINRKDIFTKEGRKQIINAIDKATLHIIG